MFVNVSAWAKSSNLKARSRRLTPSRSRTRQAGTCGRSCSISGSVSVGSSPRQAVHFISVSSPILLLSSLSSSNPEGGGNSHLLTEAFSRGASGTRIALSYMPLGGSTLLHRYVAEDQDLALKVEVGPPDAIPEPQYRLGVFHGRPKNVLLRSEEHTSE